jgi:hypothetical protein
MKKILCRVVEVSANIENYGQEFFKDIPIPRAGSEEVREMQDWYPFEKGGKDGYSVLPHTNTLKDKDGNFCNKYLYYVALEQIEIV